MPVSKKFIIHLIQQDMKHNQLILGLRKLNFNVQVHYLDIMSLVAELMEIPPNSITDNWAKTYINFLEQSVNYEITEVGTGLFPLAKECYQTLKGL